MPLTELRIPNLGEGADSGSVVSIFVKVGDKVSKDQTLLELENEKAVAPIPSPQTGVIASIHVKVGDKVTVGQVIMSLEESQSGGQAALAGGSVVVEPATVAAPSKQTMMTYSTPPHAAGGLAPAASPGIRKMANELGIDLRLVHPAESGGRVELADLKNYIRYLQSLAPGPGGDRPPKSVADSGAVAPLDYSKWGAVHRKPLTSLRQKIGQKMVESWTTIPHVTQFEEADITSLMALRKKYAGVYEKKGTRLTLTSFVLKAVVEALKKYPVFNASLDEAAHEVVYKDYVHLGVAVDTEAGLIVPVLKNADKKDLLQISQELEILAEKTRSRKISVEDLKGGSFTISNLGGLGGTFFTPIINKPELAILGVGKGALKPRVVGEKKNQVVEARLLLPLGLSYDHRVIDGADGARFIRAVAESLENFSEKEVTL